MSESLFSRLFTYARSMKADQIENFTTEALAAVIRADHRPFTSTMIRRGLLAPLSRSTQALSDTQVVIPGVGIVDLITRLVEGTAISNEVWVEAKVWAAETGNQLTRYQQHLATLGDGVHRILVTLGPKPLSSGDAIPWVAWQEIRDEVSRISDVNPLWLDFSAFLEERNVADVSSDPITAREVSSMSEAYRFFRKAIRVLSDVNDLGGARFPTWGWVSKDQMPQLVLGQFQRHARFTFSTTSKPVYLIVGFTDLLNSGEAQVTVWVENDPKRVDVRTSMIQAAEAGGLDEAWVRRVDTWQGIGRTQRAATLDGAPSMTRWFEDRLDELAAAGVVPGPSQTPP